MPPKRTYSRHNLSYDTAGEPDPHSLQPESANTCKRRKPTPPSPEPSLPHSHILNGGGRPEGLSRKGGRNARRAADQAQTGEGKRFGGPTSLPEDDMDLDEPETKKDTFGSAVALAKSSNASRQLKQMLYGGGHSSFSATLKQQKRKEKKAVQQDLVSDDSSTGGGISLDPATAAAGVLGSDEMDISSEVSDVTPRSRPTRGGLGLSAAEASARIFQGREFVSAATRPPRRTLYNDKLVTTSVEAVSWSANQAVSPLLRLPGNVRRTIFEYVLGGKTIEFGYRSYRREKLPDGEHRCVPYFKYWSNVYHGSCNPLSGWNTAADMVVTSGMTLLNGVCRQLYYETYTLPYSLNHFCFTKADLLFNLVMEERLLPQQLKAIESITTVHELPVPAVLHALPNLADVRLMHSRDSNVSSGWYDVVRGPKLPPELVKRYDVHIRGGGYVNGLGLGKYGSQDDRNKSSRYKHGGNGGDNWNWKLWHGAKDKNDRKKKWDHKACKY